MIKKFTHGGAKGYYDSNKVNVDIDNVMLPYLEIISNVAQVGLWVHTHCLWIQTDDKVLYRYYI